MKSTELIQKIKMSEVKTRLICKLDNLCSITVAWFSFIVSYWDLFSYWWYHNMRVWKYMSMPVKLYDCMSVWHYDRKCFCKDGKCLIRTVCQGTDPVTLLTTTHIPGLELSYFGHMSYSTTGTLAYFHIVLLT